MVRTPVNTASLVLLSLQKGAEHLAGESKEQQERLRNQTSKSDRADASMTGVNAMRNHDMTVMYELLSKPQSQLCKLSLQADSGKAQVQFSDAQEREETDHGEATITTML